MLSVAVFLIVLLLVGLDILMRFKVAFFRRYEVPSFPADPIFGHFKELMLMSNSPADVVMDIYINPHLKGKSYGGIYAFQTPGIFIKDLDLAKQILMKDANKFIDHYAKTDGHDNLGTNSMFFSKGGHWKQIRTKMLQAFTSAKMKNMFPLVDQVKKTYRFL